MSVVPSSSILVKPFFSQPSTENVSVADVYNTSNLTVVNSIQDQTDPEENSLKSLAIRGSKYLKNIFPTARAVLSNGMALANATTGKQRLSALISGSSSIFQSLPSSYQSLFSDDPKQLGTSIVTLGGVAQRVLNTNLGNVRSTAALIGNLAGDRNLVGVQDQDSLLSFTSTIANEAARTRIPNSISSMVSFVGNSQLINKFAKMTLPATLEFSNSLGLKDLATLAKPGDINLLNPNLITDFATMYTKPPACTAAEYATEYGNVMDAFKATNNKWNRITRQGDSDESVNITPLMNNSDDMQTIVKNGVMKSTEKDEKLYLLADMYAQTTPKKSLANAYPGTVFNSNTTTATPSYF